MITVQHPTAGTLEFPDGTSEDVMRQAMAQFDKPQAPASPKDEFAQKFQQATGIRPIRSMDDVRSRVGEIQAPQRSDFDQIKSMGAVGGGAAMGQAIGMRTGPLAPIATPLLGGAGAAIGSVIDQMTDTTEGISKGRVFGDFIGGMIPGAGITTKAGKAVVSPILTNVAGNLAATTAQAGIDRGELPTMPEAAMAIGGAAYGSKMSGPNKATPKDWGVRKGDIEAIREMRKLGVRDASGKVVQSVVVDPGSLHDKTSPFLKSFAGKAAMGQEASIVSADALHAAAREAIGLSATAEPIKPSAIAQVIKDAGEPYRKIAGMSKVAEKNLEDLKKVRLAAEQEMGKGRETDYAAYRALRDQEDILENAIEKEAKAIGNDTLVDELKASRKLIAQSYALKNSVSLNGVLDPRKLRNQMRVGVKLTDNLEKIAKFADAVERDAQPVNRVLDPNSNQLDAHVGTGSMAMSDSVDGAIKTMATFGMLPKARQYVRSYFLSPEFQNKLIDGVTPGQERFMAAMARQAAMQAGRQPGYGVLK